MAKIDSVRQTARSVLPHLLEHACDTEDDLQKAIEQAVTQAVDCAILMEKKVKARLKHESARLKSDNGADVKTPVPTFPRHKPGL